MAEKIPEKKYHRVSHQSFEPVVVLAEDRLRAIIAAAKLWGVVRWTSIARACEVELCAPPAEKKTSQKMPASAGTKKGRKKKDAE